MSRVRVECENCGRPTGDQITLCVECVRSLTADLRSVPGLVDDLSITQARLDRLGGMRHGGRNPDRPMPLRLDRDGHPAISKPFGELTDTLVWWARRICDQHGVVLARSTVDQAVMKARDHTFYDPAAIATITITPAERAAIWLAHHGRWIRATPEPILLFDAISDALALARLAVDRLPELIYKGECGHLPHDAPDEFACTADLYAERGEDYVRCYRCGTQYDVRELNRRVIARMIEIDYTIYELVKLLAELGHAIPRSTLYDWAKRGRLTARAQRGAHGTYRLGDVLALAERARKKGVFR